MRKGGKEGWGVKGEEGLGKGGGGVEEERDGGKGLRLRWNGGKERKGEYERGM